MANSASKLFHFYKRYLFQPSDFTLLQQSLLEQIRGPWEGLIGSAVLKGLGVSDGGGLSVDVAPGIAISDDGYMNVLESEENIVLTAPTVNPAWHLLVIRPNQTDVDNITSPTAPAAEVPLHIQMGCELVLIEGAESATPAYPATQAGDVVLAGIKMTVGQVAIVGGTIDTAPRSHITLGGAVGPETPSGDIDGVNAEFELSGIPLDGTLMLFLDGFLETAYTRSGSTITMTTAPEETQSLVAYYRR